MKTRTKAEIAEYFGVDSSIGSLIPTLLADFYELGSDPDRIASLLAPLGLPRDARVLDIGCGKGAVAIEVARSLGLQVRGVDMLEPFVEEARQRAEAAGVATLCTFECGDARQLLNDPGRYDVVLLISVGEIFGALDATVQALRTVARPGGYLVIDDGYLPTDARVSYPGWDHLANHEETMRRLTSCGDAIVQEALVTSEEMAEMNAAYNRRIQARVKQLTHAHPEHSAALSAYVAKELDESQKLETQIQCATWLLRVASPAPR